MIWVVVGLLAVAAVGAAVLAGYAVSMRHKIDDVRAEVGVLAGYAAQARGLAERLEIDGVRRH